MNNKIKVNLQEICKITFVDLESTKLLKTKGKNINKIVGLEESSTKDMKKSSRKRVNNKQYLKKIQQSHHPVLHNLSSRRRNLSKTNLVYRKIIQASN